MTTIRGWWMPVVAFSIGLFGSGVMFGRATMREPEYLEGDLRSPIVQQVRSDSRLNELEKAVSHLDETLVYERARLDETRQKVQADREAAIRCCEARP